MAGPRLVGEQVRVVCAMETTATMHKRLERALRPREPAQARVRVPRPRAVKHSTRALLREGKTARLDTRLIALFLLPTQVRLRAAKAPES